MSCHAGFDTHRCIAVPFPAYIASPCSLQRDIFVTQICLQSVHHRIVLPAVIRLPAQKTCRTCHTQGKRTHRKSLTDRSIEEISRTIIMTSALKLLSAGGFHSQAQGHLRNIARFLGMKPFVMQDLNVGRDIHIAGAGSFAVILIVPSINRHPYRYIRPAREQGHVHARENIHRIIVLVSDVPFARQFGAQVTTHQTVRHIDDRQSIRTEVSRRDTRRLT